MECSLSPNGQWMIMEWGRGPPFVGSVSVACLGFFSSSSSHYRSLSSYCCISIHSPPVTDDGFQRKTENSDKKKSLFLCSHSSPIVELSIRSDIGDAVMDGYCGLLII